MLSGWPKLTRPRGSLDSYPIRAGNANGNLSGWPSRATPTRLDTKDSLATGLAGWWPFNEGMGATVLRDWSLNANHASMVSMGAAKPSGWGVNDGLRSSGGLWFDGTNDYVNVPHIPALAITGDISVVQWHYPLNFTAGWWEPLRKGSGGYPQPLSISIEQTLGTFYFARGNGASQRYGFSSNVEVANRWNCAIGTNTGSSFVLYLNGIKSTRTDGSGGVSDSGGALFIGSRATSCCWFPGAIAHTRIYNRVLTDSEAARIYADPWAGAV